MFPTFDYEKKLWNNGHKIVVGIDEVGRGAFAGPLVIGAVVFKPHSKPILGINDSKKLLPKKREELAEIIKTQALAYNIAEIPCEFINLNGMSKALHEGFNTVLEQLPVAFDHILLDGYPSTAFPKDKQTGIIKGDSISISIAAASIIAKVHRDKLMRELDNKYEVYNFAKNKGYGTLAHRTAIKMHGLSDLHRTSSCKNYI